MAGDCATDLIWGAGGTNSGTQTDANQYLDDNATCHFDQDVPWLSETPVTDILASMASQDILVTFDAGVPEITQPGQYYAQLEIRTDTPYQVSNVPVTMTVPPPATWGRLAGTITSLGHCDTNSTPLGNAAVLITGASGVVQALTSDTSGTYSLWVEQGDYTVTVSAAGHVTRTISVAITAQETIIHNFNLRSIEPCISVAPLSMTATLIPGASQTQILTLTNAGAAASLFRFHEAGGGLALMKPRVDAPISVLTNGGPDTFGYTYKDSTESGGPIYDWVDISASGTPVYLSDDDGDGPFSIGFVFNFYGNDYTRVYVSSNGYLSFNNLDLTDYGNDCPLPDVYNPDDGIYLMWDDLNPGYYGDTVYYQAFTDCPYGDGQACLVVQYEDFHHYGIREVAGTFEAILFENGSTLIQFEDAGVEEGSSSTSGIENEDGTIGLTYACNTGASLSDNLAVCFAYPGQPADCLSSGVPWLSTEPGSGTVGADDSRAVTVTLAALPTMNTGVYTATLEIRTDDAVNSPLYIPMTLTVPNFWQQYMPIVFRNS